MSKILILYHYYHPDDVVSAVQFTGLGEGLASRGWEVEVWPSNRACHNPETTYPLEKEILNGVTIKRIWRPTFRQHTFLGRIINSIFMQTAWWVRLIFSPGFKPDVIITGTDPLFGILLTPFLKMIRPRAKIAHWCFDLYPEAAVADGLVGEKSFLVGILDRFLKPSYQASDLVVDLGSCMTERLKKYPVKKVITLTPWALEEPSHPLPYDPDERKKLFGDSPLGLLYSGSFGRAHGCWMTLLLAQKLRDGAVFTYGVRGSRLEELKKVVGPEDSNVRFAEFASPDKLWARISAPDIHLVSLRSEWTGLVVPSKFFGALAAGRPVLFEGSPDSCIAGWIQEYGVGWVLSPDRIEETAADLKAFSRDEKRKNEMFNRCHEVYQKHFSKGSILEGWDRELRSALAE
ncbi:MAG TPA: glycosyltransferase family 4 protein [bacterium]|nr:glycosyltransferase family 4 protein [bacterium]